MSEILKENQTFLYINIPSMVYNRFDKLLLKTEKNGIYMVSNRKYNIVLRMNIKLIYINYRFKRENLR